MINFFSLEEKIKTDRSNYISYLKNKKIRKLDEIEPQLKELHKVLWILKILEIKFEGNNYYKDIFNNVISIIFLSITNDVKGIKLFNRNTIENIFKISCIFFDKTNEINVNKKIGILTRNIIENSHEKIVKEKFSQLVNDYGNLSDIIHSNNLHLKDISTIINLNNFEKFYVKMDYIESIRVFCRDIKIFIEIYFIINNQMLSYNYFNEQEVNFFREFLSKETLEYIDNKIFKNLKSKNK